MYVSQIAEAVVASLTQAMKLDVSEQESGMAPLTLGLLLTWKQSCPTSWMQQLSAEAALLMADLLSREKLWSEIAAIFEAKAEAKQVRWHVQV